MPRPARRAPGLRPVGYALEQIVVESASYIACASACLETDVDSVPYVAGWAGDKDPVAVIRQAAGLIDELARQIEDATATDHNDEDAEPARAAA